MAVLVYPTPDGFQYGNHVLLSLIPVIAFNGFLNDFVAVERGIMEFLRPASCGIEAAEDLFHVFRQTLFALRFIEDRYTVKRFRDAPGDAGQCITVTAQGYRRPDHVLEVRPFQEGGDCFRYGLLAAFDVVVARSDLIAAAGEIIAEFLDDIVPNLLFAVPGPGQINRTGCRLRAFDALRVIVGYFGRQTGDSPGLTEGLIQPACGRYPHGRSVSIAAIGLWILCPEPAGKPAAVTRVGILPAPFPHRIHQGLSESVIAGPVIIQQCFSHCDRHDGIVSELTVIREHRKVFRFLAPVELIGGSDHISKNRSVHFSFLLGSLYGSSIAQKETEEVVRQTTNDLPGVMIIFGSRDQALKAVQSPAGTYQCASWLFRPHYKAATDRCCASDPPT